MIPPLAPGPTAKSSGVRKTGCGFFRRREVIMNMRNQSTQMMTRRAIPACTRLVAAAAIIGSAANAQAGVNRITLCMDGTSMMRFTATYTETGKAVSPVRQLDATLEVDQRAGYRPNRRVELVIDGAVFRAQRLAPDANGDLDADWKIRTKNASKMPKIRSGSVIAAEIQGKVLGHCIL